MFSLLALLWLALCTWHDLRTRTVPAFLTIPPLLAAMAWHGYSESWPVAILAVSLLVLDDLPWRWRGILAGIQGLLLAVAWGTSGAMSALLGLTLIGIWALWKFGAIGGADAQVVMTLALFFGLVILVPVAFATGLQAAIQKVRSKATLPAMLGILVGVGIHTLK
jgi:Flp pilus assembly protein protease CpaA